MGNIISDPYVSPSIRRKTPGANLLLAKNILKHLFIDPPTYLSTMALITFFYGNGIPVAIAVQLFQACNDEVTFDQTQHFFYYATWQYQEVDTHLGIYYNMRINRHMYINGSRKKQFEIAHLATDEPRGFGDLWSTLGLKIDVIRTCVCYY